MQLIDTHCHIHSVDYALPVDEVEARARDAGVTRLICVGYDVDNSRQAIKFVKDRSHAWASIGLHPHEALSGEAALTALEQLISGDGGQEERNDKIVAIGECGLDYFYAHSSKLEQEKALRFQIELALKYDRALIFHVREAFDDFWRIFDDYKNIRGVLHSFTDSLVHLERALQNGLYIGVNGIATFTKQ